MTDKDRDAFEKWRVDRNYDAYNNFMPFHELSEGEAAWKAARAESAKEIAEKDAEIERLKKEISALKECPPRKWTDEEGREWHLLDFGYGTPSDIRLKLRLGTAFGTAEYSIADTKKEG